MAEINILLKLKNILGAVINPATSEKQLPDGHAVDTGLAQPLTNAQLTAQALATSSKQDTLLTELQLKADLTESQPVEQDSGENEYTPGLGSGLIAAATPAGYTKIYDQAVVGNPGFKATTPNTAGRAFYIRSVFAASVERGAEDAPVLSLEIRNASNVAVHTPYTMSAIVKRKKIICPVNGKVYLLTDIATRLPWTIDIQEIP